MFFVVKVAKLLSNVKRQRLFFFTLQAYLISDFGAFNWDFQNCTFLIFQLIVKQHTLFLFCVLYSFIKSMKRENDNAVNHLPLCYLIYFYTQIVSMYYVSSRFTNIPCLKAKAFLRLNYKGSQFLKKCALSQILFHIYNI